MSSPLLTLEIHETSSDDLLRLTLTGELDVASAPQLASRLARLRETKSPVRLNLSRLEFIDGAGIHLLIRTVGEARIKGWRFQIEPDVGPQAMRLLRLARLDDFVMSACSTTG